MKQRYINIIVIAIFFLIWELAARAGILDTQFIPAFSTVALRMFKMMLSGELFIHISISIQRMAIGFILATIVAVPAGFILGGWVPKVAEFFNPLFTNFSQVNPFTLIPLFIILFGIGESGKISIIFWVILWPILFTTMAGINQIEPILIKGARSMGANGAQIFFKVILPGSINRIFTGIKTALTVGFTMLIGTEMVGAEAGIGWIISNSQKNYDIPKLYVGILTIAIVGALISILTDKLKESIIVWEDSLKEE
ncbi:MULTISPECIES: ABC transporter permease [unclassified Clostridium]|uniref:ABC transporter permease n=1 Tax=unclassified Clostridium TaxID=2614128 RepID=UPI0002978BFE|nr:MULTISPECIES: ABC transporter permease [unclassified Clostridium]EKQ51511.1 MAG: ABC-type nitrate/sulfonate/bicarbonate transport system, permease component [Clostridium sp. Maddingley MBC34-26]